MPTSTVILTLLAAALLGATLGLAIVRLLRRPRIAVKKKSATPSAVSATTHNTVPTTKHKTEHAMTHKTTSVTLNTKLPARPVAAKKGVALPPPPTPTPAPFPAETRPLERVSRPDDFRELLSLQSECLDVFREKKRISEDDWHAKEAGFFVVSDVFEKEPFFDYLMDYLGPQLKGKAVEKARAALASSHSIVELYAEVVGVLSEKERPAKAGRLKEPIEAEIYELRT